MKKALTVLLVVILAFTCCIPVYADMGTFALGSCTRTSSLSIGGSTATCTSKFNSENDNVSKVTIEQSLEKHSFLWAWDTVGGTWNKTSTDSIVTFTNKVSNLSSGTYRVKTVFTVTTTDGQSETVTVYSAEK